MREPIPVYIVKPVNTGGLWFVGMLVCAFLYYFFYTNLNEISDTYWFLKPVLFLPGGVIEAAWNLEDTSPTWHIILIGLAACLSPVMLGAGFALSVFAVPIWGLWWLIGDTVLAVWQPVTLGLLMLTFVLGLVFSWKWWRTERRFGSARWPGAVLVVFVIVTLPNIAYWAGLAYWDRHDSEKVESAKALLSDGDPESIEALVDLARSSGTGEVYYLAAGALTADKRYRDVAELLVHASNNTSIREMLFMAPIVKGLQRGYDTGYFDEALAVNGLPLASEFLPSARSDRIETGFNKLEDEYEDAVSKPEWLCSLPLVGVDGDSTPDILRPESRYVLAFLPTSEAGLLFCRTIKSGLATLKAL